MGHIYVLIIFFKLCQTEIAKLIIGNVLNLKTICKKKIPEMSGSGGGYKNTRNGVSGGSFCETSKQF